jgi:hypothetical protein
MIDREYLVRLGLRENDIRFSWGASPPTEFIEFRAYEWPLAEEAPPIAVFEAIASDLGLIDFSRESIEKAVQMRPNSILIPPHFAPLMRTFAASGSTLWWQIEDSSGYLPVMPWESLMWKIGKYRVVRKTATPIAAVMPKKEVNGALCFACDIMPTDAYALVVRYFDMLPGTKKEKRVHVFTNSLLRSQLQSLETVYQRMGVNVAIHHPDQNTLAPVTLGERDTSPWLRWMQSALKPYAVDFVHFICFGELGLESGDMRLPLPIEGTDSSWNVPVGPRGIDAFLKSVGCWSVTIGSPPENPSIAGLRYFTHLLAQRRAGPVILDEMLDDPDAEALVRAARTFTSSDAFEGSPSIILYRNPLSASYGPFQAVEALAEFPVDPPVFARIQRDLEAELIAIKMEPVSSRRDAKEAEFEKGAGAILASVNI